MFNSLTKYFSDSMRRGDGRGGGGSGGSDDSEMKSYKKTHSGHSSGSSLSNSESRAGWENISNWIDDEDGSGTTHTSLKHTTYGDDERKFNYMFNMVENEGGGNCLFYSIVHLLGLSVHIRDTTLEAIEDLLINVHDKTIGTTDSRDMKKLYLLQNIHKTLNKIKDIVSERTKERRITPILFAKVLRKLVVVDYFLNYTERILEDVNMYEELVRSDTRPPRNIDYVSNGVRYSRSEDMWGKLHIIFKDMKKFRVKESRSLPYWGDEKVFKTIRKYFSSYFIILNNKHGKLNATENDLDTGIIRRVGFIYLSSSTTDYAHYRALSPNFGKTFDYSLMVGPLAALRYLGRIASDTRNDRNNIIIIDRINTLLQHYYL